MFLQSYVVAVCLFERVADQAELRALQGTAFFVGKSGLFFSAKHVFERAKARCSATNWEIGLAVKGDNGKSADERVLPISVPDYAPEPYDIAVGLANYRPYSPLTLGQRDVGVWTEICSLGYPTSALVIEEDALWMNLRAHRGYVQRHTLPRDTPIGNHPNGIELSFLLGPGMSGAPVFTSGDQIVVGVGVGSHRSEAIEDSYTEILEDGTKFCETRLRIEQYGFAHTISGLLNWKPPSLGGLTLIEAC